ncbi:hypothetical protein JNUCC0626_19865 [Lentzea sp. JNUCC 0626]|uniref:hypothetical protein n=1 Tax=Lentzea sp. JNUCC 0626 TaxID=3367513 RepID=UPI0037486022
MSSAQYSRDCIAVGICPPPLEQWQQRRAVRAVAHHAQDADDLLTLLEILGLPAQAGKADAETPQMWRSVRIT